MASAVPPNTNYDESKVPAYTLPDPLVMQSGEKVTGAKMWRTQRRPEILRLFETYIYGKSPKRPAGMRFKTFDLDAKALGGKATRKQVTVYFSGGEDGSSMDMLLYLPNGSRKPVPTFLILNFAGNHSIHPDPSIRLSTRWIRGSFKGVVDHRATEASRGTCRSRFPVEQILAHGYGLATIYYGDLDPDFDDGFKNGVHGAFDKKTEGERAGDAWGSIGAWAWGLSRAMDYLETDKDVAGDRVMVLGHSRLGKTALWAGAQDERFAIVISNDSGCGGAALARRRFGETIAATNKMVPYWFCSNYTQFSDHEEKLPVDQHMLIALVAPRPVYIASAEKDLWADPKGEFLAGKHASPVYLLLGTEGLVADAMPGLDRPIHSTIGYHIRTGKHDLTAYDWNCYMTFADKHLGK